MARINLLPWREDLRKERRKQFAFIAAGSAVLMLLVILLVHVRVNGMIDDQDSRNNYLQQQITEVESKIKEIENLENKKQQLLARMRVIEQLQGNRSEIVHIFEELAKAVPDGLYLNSVKQNGRSFTINGMAQSNARVSSFMRNLDASAWFQNPVLDVIESAAGTDAHLRNFTMRVSLATNKQDE